MTKKNHSGHATLTPKLGLIWKEVTKTSFRVKEKQHFSYDLTCFVFLFLKSFHKNSS